WSAAAERGATGARPGRHGAVGRGARAARERLRVVSPALTSGDTSTMGRRRVAGAPEILTGSSSSDLQEASQLGLRATPTTKRSSLHESLTRWPGTTPPPGNSASSPF